MSVLAGTEWEHSQYANTTAAVLEQASAAAATSCDRLWEKRPDNRAVALVSQWAQYARLVCEAAADPTLVEQVVLNGCLLLLSPATAVRDVTGRVLEVLQPHMLGAVLEVLPQYEQPLWHNYDYNAYEETRESLANAYTAIVRVGTCAAASALYQAGGADVLRASCIAMLATVVSALHKHTEQPSALCACACAMAPAVVLLKPHENQLCNSLIALLLDWSRSNTDSSSALQQQVIICLCTTPCAH